MRYKHRSIHNYKGYKYASQYYTPYINAPLKKIFCGNTRHIPEGTGKGTEFGADYSRKRKKISRNSSSSDQETVIDPNLAMISAGRGGMP